MENKEQSPDPKDELKEWEPAKAEEQPAVLGISVSDAVKSADKFGG